MSAGTGKESLRVCVLEGNPLALEFVYDILRKDPSLSVLPVDALADENSGNSSTLIFLVDNCQLPLPISECLRRVRFFYPEGKCLVLDRELPKEDLLYLLRLRVDGFLPYDAIAENLLTAIHSVALGNIWVPREIRHEYVQCAGEGLRTSAPLKKMTGRETQIHELVNRRLSNKEIADILHLQESTVKFHLSNIYSKLQVSNRYDIIHARSNLSALEKFLSVLTPPNFGTMRNSES